MATTMTVTRAPSVTPSSRGRLVAYGGGEGLSHSGTDTRGSGGIGTCLCILCMRFSAFEEMFQPADSHCPVCTKFIKPHQTSYKTNNTMSFKSASEFPDSAYERAWQLWRPDSYPGSLEADCQARSVFPRRPARGACSEKRPACRRLSGAQTDGRQLPVPAQVARAKINIKPPSRVVDRRSGQIGNTATQRREALFVSCSAETLERVENSAVSGENGGRRWRWQSGEVLKSLRDGFCLG